MDKPKTFANPEVLAFYKVLPFNYREAPEQHAAALRQSNPVKAYPFLPSLLSKETRVLDVGCGAGWFSNAISFYYGCPVVGIDFNPVAIERAKAIAKILKLNNEFCVGDLFLFSRETPFDVVISHGVLHHTNDCMAGVRHLCSNLVKLGGYVLIGLYHAYGRRPFFDHFAALKASGAGEEEMAQEYGALHDRLTDEVLLKSWFRDQVLHPHETHHTLAELVPVLEDEGMRLVGTSINEFRSFESIDFLLEAEKLQKDIGETMLMMRSYYPGFFEVLAQKVD